MSGLTAHVLKPQVGTDSQSVPRWSAVVWDDPVNLMGYVAEVFYRHFGYPRSTCEALMLQVHVDGRAVVSTGLRERVEADVLALHSSGLRATVERVT